MYQTDKSHRMIGLAVTTAMAGVLLSGCASTGGTPADLAVSQTASPAGAQDPAQAQAIAAAEAAVLAQPHDAGLRAMLGSEYLEAGRFSAAASAFDNAMELGDTSARTALSLSLAMAGEGRFSEAAALLNEQEGRIGEADLGLALALAGQPQRGVHIMGNAIRGGQNTVKMRQNLAFAYALAGQWRQARLMAQQDVPANEVGDRMAEWAQLTHPLAYRHRVARLLDVPATANDPGQPERLALVNAPAADQVAALEPAPAQTAPPETAAAERTSAELPPVSRPDIALENYAATATFNPDEFERAFGAQDTPSLARVTQDASIFVNKPVVQSIPVRKAETSAPRRAAQTAARPASTERERVAAAVSGETTHLVQLGSFASEQGARRAWDIYLKRYPELAGHKMVINKAVVRGKTYWRVSAGGFDNAGSQSMCGKVKSTGEGCIAWAEGRPLPGAVDAGTRLARR